MSEKTNARKVTPYLIVRNASEAIQFYEKAFNAREIYRFENEEGTTIMHAEIMVGETPVFLADECEGDQPFSDLYRSPQTLNATSVILHIYCDDVDALYPQAVDAGAEPQMPLTDMFWGDRYGTVKDPYGHLWSLATQKKHMTVEEILIAGREAMKQEEG